jgi:two-component system alkaline phosphatase synthesis response regulator PhoP
MVAKTLFIVEDDPHIRELLAYNLEKAGFRVKSYDRGETACMDAEADPPDLVLLDLMLPGMDGLDACRRLRRNEKTARLPVIMLTARGEELDRVLGLEIGADDYIVKPFSVREVVARVRAVLRRTDGAIEEPAPIRSGDLLVDPVRREVRKGAAPLTLAMKEFDLLAYLMSHPGRVITRGQLLDQVWGYDFIGETRTVDVHIRHLRQKIEDNPEDPRYIETVRGVGYRFREQDGEDGP